MEQIVNYLYTNRQWLFSGAGLLIFSAIGIVIKIYRSKKRQNHTDNTMSQINTNNSSGTQIGVQNNYYRKDGTNEKPTD